MNKGGFSWKRALGVTKAKQSISKKTGIPLSKSGRQRKIGKTVGGCYIATCVYGSYDSNEVIILRGYRDSVLMNNHLGRFLITIYNICSPILVRYFGNLALFKMVFKKILDPIVGKLNEK